MSKVDLTGTSSLSRDPGPSSDHEFQSATGGMEGTLAKIQAPEDAWSVYGASQGEPGHTNHLWSICRQQQAVLDSGMSPAGIERPGQLISSTFPTLHGNQHLQALPLHPCWTPAHSGAEGADITRT